LHVLLGLVVPESRGMGCCYGNEPGTQSRRRSQSRRPPPGRSRTGRRCSCCRIARTGGSALRLAHLLLLRRPPTPTRRGRPTRRKPWEHEKRLDDVSSSLWPAAPDNFAAGRRRRPEEEGKRAGAGEISDSVERQRTGSRADTR
jgi:hypothetical protein